MSAVKKRYFIIGLTCLGGIFIIFTLYFSEIMELYDAMTHILAVIAATIAYIEIYKSSLTSAGEFILNLQQTYIDNPEFTKLYLKCWDEYNLGNKNIDSKENRKVIVDYLTFFESIYIMLQKGCLSIDLINELFARRFFVVVNNIKVQECELVNEDNYKYYLNVYRLYFEWKIYREKQEEKQRKNNPNYQDELIHKNNEKYRDLQKTLKPDFKINNKRII